MRLLREEKFKVLPDPELLLIPEFAALQRRDRSKTKTAYIKELAYIYFMHDHKSPYAIYTKDERLVRVIKDLGLPENYKPDSVVDLAVNKYLQFAQTPTIKTLTSIREGLLTSSRLIDTLRLRIERELKADEVEDLDALVRSVQRMLEIGEKLPKVIDQITALEEKIKKEQASDTRIKGGGKKGMFED